MRELGTWGFLFIVVMVIINLVGLGMAIDKIESLQAQISLLAREVGESQERIEKLEWEMANLRNENELLRLKVQDLIGIANNLHRIAERANNSLSIEEIKEYTRLFMKYGFKYGVDPVLLISVASAESNLRTEVKSNHGAVGEMQITPIAMEHTKEMLGEDMSMEEVIKTENNIKYGAKYLSWCLDQAGGNVNKALSKYNAGYGNVINWERNGVDFENIEEIPFKETREYVERVGEYAQEC